MKTIQKYSQTRKEKQMKILKFTGKDKSEKYTTIRVKTSDLSRIKKAFGEKNMTSTWHDIFTQMTNTCFLDKR